MDDARDIQLMRPVWFDQTARWLIYANAISREFNFVVVAKNENDAKLVAREIAESEIKCDFLEIQIGRLNITDAMDFVDLPTFTKKAPIGA